MSPVCGQGWVPVNIPEFCHQFKEMLLSLGGGNSQLVPYQQLIPVNVTSPGNGTDVNIKDFNIGIKFRMTVVVFQPAAGILGLK